MRPTLLHTIAVPPPYLRRCILGFEAEIRTNSGDGTAMDRRRYGRVPSWLRSYSLFGQLCPSGEDKKIKGYWAVSFRVSLLE